MNEVKRRLAPQPPGIARQTRSALGYESAEFVILIDSRGLFKFYCGKRTVGRKRTRTYSGADIARGTSKLILTIFLITFSSYPLTI